MKKTLLILCMLFNAMAIQCMNLALIEDINIDEIETSLNDDYQNHIKSFIEEYKKTNGSPENIDGILTMSSSITGHKNSEYIHSVKDDEGNSILTIAIGKIDLPTTHWLIEQGNTKHHSNKDYYDYVGLCVKQISSGANDTTRITAYNILKTVVEPYKARNMDKKWRKYFIKEMIALQLQHKKNRTDFIIEEDLLTPFLTQEPQNNNATISLAAMYQKVTDEDKNTLTHIVINLADIDELEKLIRKDYVSPLKNNDNFDALQLATQNFQKFSQHTSLFDSDTTQAMNTRCCYFLLLNYMLKKRKENVADCFCCPKHVEMLK